MYNMKLKDLRSGKDTEIGNIIEVAGDHSLGFFTTDKGYRVIMETYNMNKIATYFNTWSTLKDLKDSAKEKNGSHQPSSRGIVSEAAIKLVQENAKELNG